MSSVNENILNELMSRLRNIVTSSGYPFDVSEVLKASRDTGEWNPKLFGIYVEPQPEVENPELFVPGNPAFAAFVLPIQIHGYAERLDVDANAVGATEKSVTEFAMGAAIKKAIANGDAASWHTFNGNAINADPPAVAHFDEPNWNGVTVTLLVTYRVSELDPAVAG
ncbi:MAG: hypothetical protein AAFU85_26905 [Planctomycetota bacterium]